MSITIQVPTSELVETKKAFGTNFVSMRRGWAKSMRWFPKSVTEGWMSTYIDKKGAFFPRGAKFKSITMPEWLYHEKFDDGYMPDGIVFDPNDSPDRYDVRLMEGVEKCI